MDRSIISDQEPIISTDGVHCLTRFQCWRVQCQTNHNHQLSRLSTKMYKSAGLHHSTTTVQLQATLSRSSRILRSTLNSWLTAVVLIVRSLNKLIAWFHRSFWDSNLIIWHSALLYKQELRLVTLLGVALSQLKTLLVILFKLSLRLFILWLKAARLTNVTFNSFGMRLYLTTKQEVRQSCLTT